MRHNATMYTSGDIADYVAAAQQCLNFQAQLHSRTAESKLLS